MTSLISELPPELLEGIFMHLDWLTIVKLREVSWLLRDIVDKSATLRYIVSLTIAGLKDGPAVSPLSALDRLGRLEQYQHAWNKLQHSSFQTLTHQSGGLWEMYSGVFAQVKDDGTFTFHRLASNLRQVPFQEWTVKHPNFDVRDFGMDYSQNLLVWIENPQWHPVHLQNRNYRIHLRNLSDGNPHPDAPKSAVLIKEQKPVDPMVSFGIQVCGPCLGIHFISHSQHAVHEINVWNWKTGELLLHVYGDEITSFVFLSEQHIIVTCVVFESGIAGVLRVIDSSRVSPERTEINEIGSILWLPRWDSQCELLDLTIRCDPAPGWKPKEPEAIFVSGSDERVYVVSMQSHVRGRHVSMALCALQSKLLRAVSEQENGDNISIPWASWGPHSARILNLNSSPSRVWVCYTFGTKFVHQRSQIVGDTQELYADVYDFNQLAIRKEGGEESDTSSSIIPSGLHVFKEDTVTSLPYRKTSLNLTQFKAQLNTVMCSQDNLILVCRDGDYRILNF